MNLFKKKELAVTEKAMPPVTTETITKYMRTFGLGKDLLDHELEAFKEMAIMHNLNPFNREIYCTAYGTGDKRTLSIVTGYEVYIRKAEQSGLLEYWMVEEPSPETPIEKYWATLIVKRTDRAREQAWTTHYGEAVQKKYNGQVTAFWQKQPRMMTKKVAMSQGFRLFFEDVMHGIPYTREEMPEDKGGMTDVTPQPKRIKEDSEGVELSMVGTTPPPEAKNITPEPQEENTFKTIIKILNTSSIDPMAKIKIMTAARECNGDEAQLATVLKNMKKEYDV